MLDVGEDVSQDLAGVILVGEAVDDRHSRVARESLDDLYVMSMPPEDIELDDQVFMANPLVLIAGAGELLLRRESWTIPDQLPFGDDGIVPLAAGETLHWRLVA